MSVDYVLTSFSPAMLGPKATVNFRIIGFDEASALIAPSTVLLATRMPHEELARGLFPHLSHDRPRYVVMDRAGKSAIFIRYQGPPIPPGGVIPAGASVTYYHIDVV